MAKGIKSKTRTVALANCLALSDAADGIGTEAFMGTTRNGLLVLNVLTTSEIDNIGVFSSVTSDFLTAGSAGSSDDQNLLVQDTVNSTATVTVGSTGTISSISAAGVYVFNVHNLRKYANIQFDNVVSDTAAAVNKMTATLVGLDLEQAPHAAATTSY